jgi:hypothetical protein
MILSADFAALRGDSTFLIGFERGGINCREIDSQRSIQSRMATEKSEVLRNGGRVADRVKKYP